MTDGQTDQPRITNCHPIFNIGVIQKKYHAPFPHIKHFTVQMYQKPFQNKPINVVRIRLVGNLGYVVKRFLGPIHF